MEALAALGVAAAAAQFVDFATELLAAARDYRDDSSTAGHAQVLEVTRDLADLVTRLQPAQSNILVGGQPVPPSNLQNLARSCHKVAKELLATLRPINPGPQPSRKSCAATALRTAWNKNKITACQAAIEKYKTEICVHILVELRFEAQKSGSRHDEVLARLDSASKEVIGTVLARQEIYKGCIEACLADLRQSAESGSTAAERRHAEILDAIERLNGGHDPAHSGLDLKRNCLPSDADGVINDDARAEIILKALKLSYMDDREDKIKDAHPNTFEWLFHRSEEHWNRKAIWTNFARFTTNGEGCFWISGKAGSGKSTLCKFLVRSKRFSELLRVWAGNDRLILASFFFWNLGTVEQKSQRGLLQSILYQMLREHRDLIPLIMEDMWQETDRVYLARQLLATNMLSTERQLKQSDLEITPPSEAGLCRALKAFTQRASQCKICLLIDGIDEYDGNYGELSIFLKSLTNTRCKINSSRPIRECEDVFASCAKLRLHELTGPDIYSFTTAKLDESLRFRRLKRQAPQDARNLKQELISKAAGVFLWVTLAITSLLQGLEDYDSLDEMRKRLRALPPELKEMYGHMLAKMREEYRSPASLIFQIVERARTIESRNPINALMVYFAKMDVRESQAEVLCLRLDASELLREIKRYLLTRCCGILEVHGKGIKAVIEYLHRSVTEYLLAPEVWSLIEAWHGQPRLELNSRIFRGHLRILQHIVADRNLHERVMSGRMKISLRPQDRDFGQLSPLAKRYTRCVHANLRTAYMASKGTEHVKTYLLDEFDRTMQIGMASRDSKEDISWTTRTTTSEVNIKTFLHLAVYLELHDYVGYSLQKNAGPEIRSECLQIVLEANLGNYAHECDTADQYRRLPATIMVETLLVGGLAPNSPTTAFGGLPCTPWEHVLYLPSRFSQPSGIMCRLLAILELFVQHGADLTAGVGGDRTDSAMTVHSIITNVFERTAREMDDTLYALAVRLQDTVARCKRSCNPNAGMISLVDRQASAIESRDSMSVSSLMVSTSAATPHRHDS